jgi:hypothetical protein
MAEVYEMHVVAGCRCALVAVLPKSALSASEAVPWFVRLCRIFEALSS